jgi:perosamine synthetase
MMMKKNFVEEIIKVINKKFNRKKYFLHEPSFNTNDIKDVIKCIRSSFVSTAGKYSNVFEKKLSQITNSKYVISTINGTSALHSILNIIKVGKNDEVLVPSLTFVGTANAIKYCNANPNFVDVSYKTFGIDPTKLEKYLNKTCIIKKNKCLNKKTKKNIKALICVHVFGHAAEINEISRICKKYKIILIEDAAEAIGSYYKNKHLGTFGDFGMISFNGNKIITTGSGGAILTSNINHYKKLLKLVSVNKEKHQFEYRYESVGYNYKMPSLNASLGISQLRNLKKIILDKRKIFNFYKKIFKEIKGVSILEEPKNSLSNYWLNTIVLDKKCKFYKNKIIKSLIKNKFYCRPLWQPLHSLPQFKKYQKDRLNVTNDLYKRCINLPSSIHLLKKIKYSQ